MFGKPFPNSTPIETELLMKELKKLMRDNEQFKRCITELVSNYISMLDNKINAQDLNIAKMYRIVLEYHPEAEGIDLAFYSGEFEEVI